MQPWNFGGKEERLRHLQESSKKNLDSEFEVFYATMKWWDKDPPKNHIAISKLYPMYHGDRRSIRQALFFSFACIKVIRLKPDIIEVDQVPILPVFVLKVVAKISKASLSVTWHEVWDKETWSAYLGVFGKLASRIEFAALKLPDQIVAVSMPTRFKLIRVGVPEDKIDLIEPDIDRASISQATTKLPATDLLFAGRLIANKNIELIFQTMAILAKEEIFLTASIVGDGPELSNLQKLAEEIGIKHQVTFHGFLPHNEDVWGLMKKCAIFISPSTREGFGFSVMEAQHAGSNVIIADHPDNAATYYMAELDGVTIVKDPSAKTYAETIKGMLLKLRSVKEGPEIEILDIYEKYEKSWIKLKRARGYGT